MGGGMGGGGEARWRMDRDMDRWLMKLKLTASF